ncbi:TPA: fimbrial protein [Serratia marcescens]
MCTSSIMRALILLLASVGSGGIQADTSISISGTVMAAPSCVINGNELIFVDFGRNVVTTLVDGENYLREVNYTLECKNNTTNALKMQVQGNVTAFNGSAVQTTKSDLGVALHINGQPMTINRWYTFTYPNKPLLQAVPVKRPGSTLTVGGFNAGATLNVDYQ